MRRRPTGHAQHGRDPHIYDDAVIAADEEIRLVESVRDHGPSAEVLRDALVAFRSETGKPVSKQRATWATRRYLRKRDRAIRRNRRSLQRLTAPAPTVTGPVRELGRTVVATIHCAAVARGRSGGRAAASSDASDPDGHGLEVVR